MVAAVLRGVEEVAGGMGITLHVHVKPKGESGSEQMAELMAGVSASGSPPQLGTLTKVRPSLATPHLTRFQACQCAARSTFSNTCSPLHVCGWMRP